MKDDSLIYVCILDRQGNIKLIKSGKHAAETDAKEIIKITDLILAPEKPVKKKSHTKKIIPSLKQNPLLY